MTTKATRFHTRPITALIALMIAAALLPLTPAAASAAPGVECWTQRLDPALGVDDAGKWKLIEIKELPERKLLSGNGDSAPIPFVVAAAGPHTIWLQLYTDADKLAAILALVRAPNGEAVRAERIDAPFHRLKPAKPYLEQKVEREAGLRWHSFTVAFEYPGDYSLTLCPAVSKLDGRRAVSDIFVSNDPAFDPAKADPTNATTATPPTHYDRVLGMQLAHDYPLHISLYCGITNANERFEAALIQNASIYRDPSAMILMGVTHQQGANGYDAKFNRGIVTTGPGPHYTHNSSDFRKATPAPEGRFVNAAGTVGQNFSLCYQPAMDDAVETGLKRMQELVGNPGINAWSIAGEQGGVLDYSEYAVKAFRDWLQEKYGTIDKLNAAWRSNHASFAEISPAANAATNKTNWLEFRDFSGKVFVKAIARNVALVNANDPHKRPATAQFSNLDLLASKYATFRPVSFEELILEGMRETDNIAWDGYCADDFMGADVDLVDSLGRGKKMLQRETNTHTPDVALAARTYWTIFGKGVKGISLFQFHEGGAHDSYPKWALTNTDMSPRDKLGAYSDQMHEIHRLENIVATSVRRHAVKPVAIFYNHLDMTLSQAPLASSWGEGIDSPYHIYEILRGRGYAVTFITDRQINDGLLSQVAAVILADAQHISTAACNKLIAWVEAGGVAIADTWPGAHTELGHRQDKLIEFFGVRSRETKKVDSIKLEESPQGYGEMTISAINPDTLYNTVMETWQQWDATHPVARQLGNWMFSGFGAVPVECTDGEVIGMVFGGHPGVVINQPGKGHTLYISTMLGSLYGGSCTRYEWSHTHSYPAPARLLDAFLEYAGVAKSALVELPERHAAKVRVESPLVDANHNAIITLTSFNDQPLTSFPLQLTWPEKLPPPRKLFALAAGTRQIEELPFEFKAGTLSLQMPGFETHATLLALQESVPLLSLAFKGAPRGVANLLTLQPGDSATVEVTVYNVSNQPLNGVVTARLPSGWYYDQGAAKTGTIKPWGQRTLRFKLAAPQHCAAKRLRPLSFIFEADTVRSMPTTEIVWWQEKQ